MLTEITGILTQIHSNDNESFRFQQHTLRRRSHFRSIVNTQ